MSGGCRRGSPRPSPTPLPSRASRRSSAVPSLPLAPVTATVRPCRCPRESSAMACRYPSRARGTGGYGRAVINGAHVILYSSDAAADRRFLLDLLGRPSVDAGGGWLIAQLPPAEVAVHPAESSGAVELYLVCDDVDDTVAEWTGRGVVFEGPVSDERWGRVTSFRLPGGGRIGLYEARHPVAFAL